MPKEKNTKANDGVKPPTKRQRKDRRERKEVIPAGGEAAGPRVRNSSTSSSFSSSDSDEEPEGSTRKPDRPKHSCFRHRHYHRHRRHHHTSPPSLCPRRSSKRSSRKVPAPAHVHGHTHAHGHAPVAKPASQTLPMEHHHRKTRVRCSGSGLQNLVPATSSHNQAVFQSKTISSMGNPSDGKIKVGGARSSGTKIPLANAMASKSSNQLKTPVASSSSKALAKPVNPNSSHSTVGKPPAPKEHSKNPESSKIGTPTGPAPKGARGGTRGGEEGGGRGDRIGKPTIRFRQPVRRQRIDDSEVQPVPDTNNGEVQPVPDEKES
ncbi:serine/arginine repetitive matrix protein 3-like [Drosophila rhopaloa]|uniref:Uncharacterized protein n=1 Tax=Drosophila rhopaloa TaxID=1041015 RepID=A0ABM5J2G3_DRORH|nr:serine/arginine repetitive matrix protein 3-like [Drosophila rhopaloa]